MTAYGTCDAHPAVHAYRNDPDSCIGWTGQPMTRRTAVQAFMGESLGTTDGMTYRDTDVRTYSVGTAAGWRTLELADGTHTSVTLTELAALWQWEELACGAFVRAEGLIRLHESRS